MLQNNTLAKTFKLPANVEMIQIQNSFTGNNADNWIFASGRAGTLKGLGGNDTIRTGPGGMTAEGGDGNDNLIGDNGKDTLKGGNGGDTLWGGDNNDSLLGNNGNDVLSGSAGNDTLTGGPGADTLTGGEGKDVFDFNALNDSPNGSPDVILDFEGAGAGDLIDVRGIDANINIGGNQAFLWGGTGKGTIHAENAGTDTVFLANTDGDTAYELRIVVHDGAVTAAAYTAADLFL